jgi:hypothetical protein
VKQLTSGAPDDARATALGAATHCLERGWAPLPILLGSKAPGITNWTELRFGSTAELEAQFEDSNVGLILGAASSGLVDVDLDCAEARRLAPVLLPHTGMRHGRPSAPGSHYWYTVDREVATAKFQDPLTKKMLLELRSTGGQTVIPPSLHPTGERLEWVGGWGEPKAMPAAQLQARVRVLAAASLLARYWPESGGRHDATLALAGGLLRSGWTERNASYFVCEVGAAVDPGVDRKDREAAVASTARRLEQDAETRGWRTLGEFVDPRVVSKVREWLDLTEDDAESETTEPGEIAHRIDLGELVREGVPDPEWLLPGLLYRGQIHWWHGEPGDGKTFLLLGLAYQLCQQGRKVLWLDEESGQVQTARRLQSYGAEPEVLTERFLYHSRPGLTLDPADLDALFRTVAEDRPDMVVLDSVADVLGQAGLDEDSNVDVTRWVKAVLEPLKFEYGCTVVAIDHVTKSKDSRGKYARGAGAKKSKTDAAWKVIKVKEFGVSRVGLIRLESDKDRDGWLEPKLAFRIGGQGGRTILEPVEAIKAGGNTTPEGEIAQRIVEFLRLNADSEVDAQPTREIEAAVTGKNATIRETLHALLEDESVGVRMKPLGRAQLWWFEDLSESVELDFRSLEG